MADSLTVRHARPDDYEAWLPLWLGYNAFYGREGPTAPTEAITRLTWSRFFDALEPMECLVAELDGRLVGLAHLIFHRNTSLAGSTCYLQDLFVDPEVRGTGAGRALLRHIVAQARERGIRSLWLETGSEDAFISARALYASEGFAPCRPFEGYAPDPLSTFMTREL